MYIIARDGSGDFTSIQAAVDAVPFGNRAPVILLVRMDEYHERVIVNKDNPELTAAFNKTLKEIVEDGTYDKLIKEYLG